MSPGRRVFALLSDGSRCSLRGDRLNDEEAGILAALLGKLYKSGHDDG
jgi:hypothetical protein